MCRVCPGMKHHREGHISQNNREGPSAEIEMLVKHNRFPDNLHCRDLLSWSFAADLYSATFAVTDCAAQCCSTVWLPLQLCHVAAFSSLLCSKRFRDARCLVLPLVDKVHSE